MARHTEKIAAIDEIDREILKALVRNSRISFSELARDIRLSPNAAAERVRRMERDAVIVGYRVELNPRAFGRRLRAFVDVKLRPDTPAEAFERAVEQIPGVAGFALLTGGFDYSVEVECANEPDLVRLVEAMRKAVPLAETYSRVVLRERKIDTI